MARPVLLPQFTSVSLTLTPHSSFHPPITLLQMLYNIVGKVLITVISRNFYSVACCPAAEYWMLVAGCWLLLPTAAGYRDCRAKIEGHIYAVSTWIYRSPKNGPLDLTGAQKSLSLRYLIRVSRSGGPPTQIKMKWKRLKLIDERGVGGWRCGVETQGDNGELN